MRTLNIFATALQTKKLETQLKSIAEIKAGVYCQTGGLVDAVYLQASDLQINGTLLSNFKYNLHITGNLRNRTLQYGDVVLMAKGVNNLAFAYNPNVHPVMVPSTAFLVAAIRGSAVLPEYLAWYFNQPQAQQFLKAQAKGASPASITVKILGELQIKVPSIAIQKSILKIAELQDREKQLKYDIEHLNKMILNYKLSKALEL